VPSRPLAAGQSMSHGSDLIPGLSPLAQQQGNLVDSLGSYAWLWPCRCT